MTNSFTRRFGLCASLAGIIAFSTACGGTSTNNDSGTDAGTNNNTDSGSNNQTDAGNTDAGATPVTYCDGFGAEDSSNTLFYVGTFSYGGTLKTEGCLSAIESDPNGTSLTTISGIYEIDTSDNGAGSPVAAIFPGDCDDFGMTGFTVAAGATVTPVAGASTVAASYGKAPPAAGIYGVVTAVNGWKYITATDQDSGEVYIQDATTGTPAKGSGVEVYFPKPATATTYGTAPTVGQVVNITGLTWSPYQGVNQFEASATTVVSVVGSAALPPAVPLTATVIGTAMSGVVPSGYEGMRVSVTGGPFKITGSEASTTTCPTALQYTSGG